MNKIYLFKFQMMILVDIQAIDWNLTTSLSLRLNILHVNVGNINLEKKFFITIFNKFPGQRVGTL